MKIIIPGIPTPQARMRHRSFGKFVTTYDPNAKVKAKIRQGLKEISEKPSFEYPRVSFLFLMPIPKSLPKKFLNECLIHNIKHTKKPDIDNFCKLYLDCLDGIILNGDQKVSIGGAIKIYHSQPKTIIWINETTQKLTPYELDMFVDVSEFAELNSFEEDSPHGSCIPGVRVLPL